MESGVVDGPEMRHEASLSPIALLRGWQVDIAVQSGAVRHTLKGKATAYGRGLSLAAARASYAMGINVFRYKVLSFCIGAFFAGVGGALLGTHLSTIDPKMFNFLLTFNVLMMLPGGNALLKPEQQGLAELTASTIGDGCGKLDAQAVEKYFADRAASLSAKAGLQTFTVSVTGPARFNADYFAMP